MRIGSPFASSSYSLSSWVKQHGQTKLIGSRPCNHPHEPTKPFLKAGKCVEVDDLEAKTKQESPSASSSSALRVLLGN